MVRHTWPAQHIMKGEDKLTLNQILSTTNLHARINPILSEFVLSCWDGDRPKTCPTGVTSPFDARLREAGWQDGRDEDDSDIDL